MDDRRKESSGKFLSVEEVADIYGLSLSTVYRQVNSGVIAAKKVGKQWRIPESEVYSLT
jgi:excisionase family DNA binding protein